MDCAFVAEIDVEIDYLSFAPAGTTFESHSSSARLAYTTKINLQLWGIQEIKMIVPDQRFRLIVELSELETGNCKLVSCEVNLTSCQSVIDKRESATSLLPKMLSLTLSNCVYDSKYEMMTADATGELHF
jgi:hypothetical protein